MYELGGIGNKKVYSNFLTSKVRTPINLNDNFNRNVLGIVCLVGLLRVSIEFYRAPNADIFDFYLDVGYSIIFASTLFALWKKATYRVIYYSFYVPLVILILFTLYHRKGLASDIENNIHVIIIMIALTMRSSDAVKFSFYLIIGSIIALVGVEMRYHFLDNYIGYSTSHFNFIFMSIGTIVITFYAKRIFENDKVQLSESRTVLTQNQETLKSSQVKLELQTQELEVLNKGLEEKVDERLVMLGKQKEAMKKYLDVMLEELQMEYHELEKLSGKVLQDPEDKIAKMMLKTSIDLGNEIESVVQKLKEEQ